MENKTTTQRKTNSKTENKKININKNKNDIDDMDLINLYTKHNEAP